MTNRHSCSAWQIWIAAALAIVAPNVFPAEPPPPPQTLTRAAAVRDLTPAQAGQRLPVRLRGVVTFFFSTNSCFVQDESAGIFVGNGTNFSSLTPGDLVLIEGVSDPGEYAPLVSPSKVQMLGHTNLPPTQPVSFEDLMTGREDSQYVEVRGLGRSVWADPGYQVLEIVSGGGRLAVFIPASVQSNLLQLVDSQVRVRGVCGTWFNRQRQLFGVRLLVPRAEDIMVETPAATNLTAQPAQAIGDLLRFAANASGGHRLKVKGTVALQQPGRALFVQDGQQGLYVQTRQRGRLQPGDQVQLLGFPASGDYTPMLQDGAWRRVGFGPEPQPVPIRSDEALSGLYDSRLVTIEGWLLNQARNNRETVLALEADGRVFSAQVDYSPEADRILGSLLPHTRVRLTGVCRIAVGEEWRAGPQWRAEAFRILLRGPTDVQVLAQPPWWTLTRLLWAVGVLTALGAVSLTWIAGLRRKVGQQTTIIRRQLGQEAKLKERYQELFENAKDMVYTHDLSGHLTTINRAGEELLGRDRNDIIGKRLLDFVAEEQRPSASQWLEHILDGTAPEAVEWDFVTGAGARVRLEISTRLVEHEGQRVEVEGIAREVTERRRLEKEILEISTREQRRIGHDLHDGVCQQLSGIAFISDVLAGKLDEGQRAEAEDAHRITELVNKANRQARSLARGLFPVRLEESGLLVALRELAEDASAFFNTRCEFLSEAAVVVQEHIVAHHLFYIAQEAILNAVKHGKPTLIQIQLAPAGRDGYTLIVRDNGSGLTGPLKDGPGMGIRIMKYRAKMIGAEVNIAPRAGGGVEVACRFATELRSGPSPSPATPVALP